MFAVSLYGLYKDKSSATDKIAILEQAKNEIAEYDPGVLSEQQAEEILGLQQKIDSNLQYFNHLDGSKMVLIFGKIVVVGIVVYFAARLVNLFLFYLFPRGVLLIGSEVNRYKKLLSIRKNVFGALIGLFIAVMGSFIVKKFIN